MCIRDSSRLPQEARPGALAGRGNRPGRLLRGARGDLAGFTHPFVTDSPCGALGRHEWSRSLGVASPTAGRASDRGVLLSVGVPPAGRCRALVRDVSPAIAAADASTL